MTAPKSVTRERLLRGYFLLLAFGAVIAAIGVFASPSEGSNAWLLGLSKTRWLLALVLFAIAVAFAGLCWVSVGNPRFWKKIEKRAIDLLQSRLVYSASLAISLLGMVALFYLTLLTFKFTDAFVHVRLLRLLPLTLWLLLYFLANIIVIPRFHAEAQKNADFSWREILLPAAIALSVLGLVVTFILSTRLGLEPDRTGWGIPGVPLMGTQILTAIAVAMLFCAALFFLEKKAKWKPARIELVLVFSFWLLAIFLWQSEPLKPTFFSPSPLAPNSEFYPYSDAGSHDLVAQNLLIGEGFTPVAEKPLYSFFLAGLHVLGGQDYGNVVAAQIVVLAIFPAVLFLLASQLHHRFSGALLAVSVILRERNTIALSGQIDVSHSQLLMTDLPTALGLALFTLLLFRWLKKDPRTLRWPLFVGSTLGALLLLRSQDAIFLPLVLILALLHGGKTWRLRLQHAAIFLLGFSLVALPWLVRNGIRTGQFGYSQPLQALYMAKQYSLTPETNDPGFPTDTPVSDYVSLGFAHVFEFARNYPGEVASFVGSHFLHNEVSAFLALPIRFDLTEKIVKFYNLSPYWVGAEGRLWSECCSLPAHISTNPYWNEWDGLFPPEARLPIAFNLSILALGLGVAWWRHRWLGLLPAGMHLIYNLSTAVARVSGWRLNLPVDWVLLLYYCLGIGQLGLWAWTYLSGRGVAKDRIEKERTQKKRVKYVTENLYRLAALMLVAGLAMPVTEMLLPARYQKADLSVGITAWQQSPLANQNSLDIAAFLKQPGAVVRSGRALWPRFYTANNGEPGGQWPAFNPLPFSRVGFILIGPQGDQVVLPLTSTPAEFPNASDVLVFGCEEDGYLRAFAVIFTGHVAPDLITDIDTYSCSTN